MKRWLTDIVNGMGGAGLAGKPAAGCDSLAAGAGGLRLMAAKKKKKKKKKASPPPPKARKPQRRKAAPAARVRRDSAAARADRFFSGWLARAGLRRLGSYDWGRLAVLALSLLLLFYYSFRAGGYFVIPRSYGALFIFYLLAMALLFRLHTGVRLQLYGWLVAVVFGAYSLWTLLSVTWSLVPAASLNEFNRAMLYLAGFLIFLFCVDRREWLRGMGHLFAFIALVVGIAALSYKVVPDIVFSPTNELPTIDAWITRKIDVFNSNRVSYPLTYWNTVALMMLMALPLALRVLVDKGSGMPARAYYAAASFIYLATLFFTFSRAGLLLVALVVGLYVLIGGSRLRTVLQGGLAAFWTGVVVLLSWKFLPAMVATTPSIEDRVSQGHQLGWLLLLMLPLVAGMQWVVAGLDRRVELSRAAARKVGMGLGVAGVVLVLAMGALFVGGLESPGEWLSAQWSAITETKSAGSYESAEDRLLSLQSERFKEYGVSVQWFSEHPLKGTGAGSWELVWLKYRPAYVGEDGNTQVIKVKDGHSWLFESMAELGIVGTLLLLAFVAMFFVASIRDLRRTSGPDRELYGAFFIAATAFLAHAMIDWDWEMPVVALPFFMFAGALLKFGALVRADDSGGEGDIDRPRSFLRHWPWLAGLLTVLAMLLTLAPLVSAVKMQTATQALQQARLANERQDTAGVGTQMAIVEAAADTARSYNPLDAEPLEYLSVVRQYQGDLPAAEELLLQARDLEPNSFEIYQRLTEVYLSKGDIKSALETVVLARENNPLESSVTGMLEEQVFAEARKQPDLYPPPPQ